MPSPTTITIPQLARLIGTPDAPVLIDVCIDDDFNEDPRLIPGSHRHPFADIAAIAPRLEGKRAAIICHKGLKLSAGCAAILREHGVLAENLEGGIVAWREAGQPLVPVAKLPPLNSEGRTIWVTRHRPKIDRIACPWLIRRFVDPRAQFLFVAPSDVEGVAEKTGGPLEQLQAADDDAREGEEPEPDRGEICGPEVDPECGDGARTGPYAQRQQAP